MASKLRDVLDWFDRTYQKMDDTQHSRFADLEASVQLRLAPRQRVIG
jgi:hypothetical protein